MCVLWRRVQGCSLRGKKIIKIRCIHSFWFGEIPTAFLFHHCEGLAEGMGTYLVVDDDRIGEIRSVGS